MTPPARLRQHLVSAYAQLRRRLTHIVGSADDACDALQETWLRLEGVPESTLVRNHEAYLLAMATNIALNARRANHVLIDAKDIEEVDELADTVHNPVRVVAARQETEAMQAVLARMPPRRRAILLTARVEGASNAEIAHRFGISLSMVNKEMRLALAFCRKHMPGTDAAARSQVMGRRKL